MDLVFVYSLTFADGKQYIGRSKDPIQRLMAHSYSMRSNQMAEKLSRPWHQFGRPKLEVICSCFSTGDAIEVESMIIADRDTIVNGYNSNRGESNYNYKNPAAMARMMIDHKNEIRRIKERKAQLSEWEIEKRFRRALSDHDRKIFDKANIAHAQARRFACMASRPWSQIKLPIPKHYENP